MVDTRGLNSSHIGKHLRVALARGESMEIHLRELTVCAEAEPCCGITYILLSTDRPENGRENGSAYWTGFEEIREFQVLGD
ncbi:MAG TPA: hypothetical protein VGR58_10705 [Candidatus Acidoferrum sp.]|nr:hypothetical protein [Candidatus Acidoferrum sp.]